MTELPAPFITASRDGAEATISALKAQGYKFKTVEEQCELLDALAAAIQKTAAPYCNVRVT